MTCLRKNEVLLVVFLAAAALATIAVVAFIDPTAATMSLLSDDAFYYFKIAQNIHAGAGVTFDGIVPTNGFHPMWMLFVIVVYGLPYSNPETPVVVIMVINVLLAVLSLFFVFRLVERHIAPGYGSIAVAAALLPNLLTAMTNGLETGLQILLVILFVYVTYRHRLLETDAPPAIMFYAGAFLGVVTLSRLDSVFLFGAVCLLVLANSSSGRVRILVRKLVLLILGFTIAVAPYLIFNLVSFGHLGPISGAVKSSFPQILDSIVVRGDKLLGGLMLLVLIGLLIAGSPRRRFGGHGPRSMLSSPLLMIVVACALHFIHLVLFLGWGVYWWHFTLYGVGIVLALPRFVDRATGNSQALRRVATVGLVIVLITVASVMKQREIGIKKNQHSGWQQAAFWARDNTPQATVIAIVDAGLFGYFSERAVINLDGKANGYEYLAALNAGATEAYLRRVDTEYVANIRTSYVSGVQRIPLVRVNQPSDQLLLEEEWEVYRSPPIPDSAPRFGNWTETHFVIWKLPASQ